MSSIHRLPSGRWRVQIRRGPQYASRSFLRQADAKSWALDMERRADRGESLQGARPKHLKSFSDLIDLHIADMAEVGKPLRRSKAYSLELLAKRLGYVSIDNLNRVCFIEYGRERRRDGAGPATVAAEFSYIGTVILHAASVHGIPVSKEPVDQARTALRRLGIIGSSVERDRRPTQSEIDRILAYVDENPRQKIPIGQIVRFALATGMRQSEIARICWEDVDERRRTVLVRDRKDPRRKDGNHQRVPLLDLTGYDAWALLQVRKPDRGPKGRIFPYCARSVGTAFRRACRALKIKDLRFHDLRHEATSRLFEAGLKIEQVALVTGHKDWKMLRRYTHLEPSSLVPEARAEARRG